MTKQPARLPEDPVDWLGMIYHYPYPNPVKSAEHAHRCDIGRCENDAEYVFIGGIYACQEHRDEWIERKKVK